jgi:hypothetical protein
MKKRMSQSAFLVLLLVILLLAACDDRRGQLYPNIPPTVRITSYEGVEDPEALDEPALFQQRIFWQGTDPDGVVEGYAYRVMDENENPIATSGKEVVDEDGWVYHYKEGADTSIPLDESDEKTIWTNDVSTVINFPAHVDGDSAHVTSIFEVKCIDDREAVSEPARKYFLAKSHKPMVNVLSSRGDIMGRTIGMGVRLVFNIRYNDPFIDDGVADHFKFKIEKRDVVTGEVIPPEQGGYEEVIWDTKDQNDIYRRVLTSQTDPPLIPNDFVGEVEQDSTHLTVWGVHQSGVVSDSVEISFLVKEGFYPSTIFYTNQKYDHMNYVGKNATFVLGANHYVPYYREAIGRLIPNVTTAEGIRFATPFFIDKDGKYNAMHSTDLRIWLRWGHHGEYGKRAGEGFIITNDPNDVRAQQVLDEQTGQPYFTEIIAYDLRMNDQPYVYGPLPAAQHNIVDDDGTEWLRVPVGEAISQRLILSRIPPGEHKIEVRAVDLQDVVDQTPVTFDFNLKDRMPTNQKNGILLINDTQNHPTQSPREIIDQFYQDIFDWYDGPVDYLNRSDLRGTVFDSELHYGDNVFSPSDFEDYKIVVYYSDRPLAETRLPQENDVFNLYLRGGGNVILSLNGVAARNSHHYFRERQRPMYQRYFGIPMTHAGTVKSSSGDWFEKPYFIGANSDPVNGPGVYVPLNLTDPFNPMMNNLEGLPGVAYFVEDEIEAEAIYRFECKEVGAHQGPTNQDEFDQFNDKPVALRYQGPHQNLNFMFGFPLSYMEKDAVRNMMQQIVPDIEGN